MADAVGLLVGTLLTAAVGWWLSRSAAADPPVEDDALVLRYPAAFAVIGWVTVAAGVALAVAAGLVLVADLGREWLAVVGVGAMFVAPGAWFVVVQRRERFYVRPDGMETRDLWGRSRRLAWAEVERVTYGRFRRALTFHGNDGQRLRASAYLVGARTLADLTERHLAYRGGAEAAQAFRINV